MILKRATSVTLKVQVIRRQHILIHISELTFTYKSNHVYLYRALKVQVIRGNIFPFTSQNSHLQTKPCLRIYRALPVCCYRLPSNQMWWNCLTTIQRGADGLVKESLDGMRVPWRFVVSELHSRVRVAPPGAVLVEAADGPCQAWLPPVRLRHRLCNSVRTLGVCEGLVVDNLTRFCDAEDSNLGSYVSRKHDKHKNLMSNFNCRYWTRNSESTRV